jgi:ABC-2 type transport system permease protein
MTLASQDLLTGEEPPIPGLWRSVGKLLQLRLLIVGRSFRRSRLRNKIGLVILALAVVGFLGFIFFMSWHLLRLLTSPQMAQFTGNLAGLVESIPNLIIGATFLGVFLTSFGVLLQALYLSGDMDFLLTTPAPIRAVFIAKLLQAVLPNFALLCLFALPVLFGLGASAGYTILYYPGILLILAMLALAAAGLAALMVMVTVRIFPARRVAEVLGFIGAISSFICSQTGQLARWSSVSSDQAVLALAMVERFNQPWSPLMWAGSGVTNLGKGNWLVGLGQTTTTLALSGVIFAISLVAAERLYYSGWASMQNMGRKRKASRSEGAPAAMLRAAGSLGRFFPSPVRAILVKDWLVLRRDLRNLSQLVTPLIIGIVYAFMILRGGERATMEPSSAPVWVMDMLQSAQAYASVGLSLFVGWMLLGRLAGMGFSQEGRSYWILKASPVSTGHLIAAKFMVAYLPTLALSWVFLMVIWLLQRSNVSVFLYSLPVIALCIAGNAGLNLAFGIAGANMNWEDPRQMQRTASGCLSALATMIYLPITLLLFFGPPVLLAALGLPEIIGQAIGLVLGGGLSLVCVIVPLWLVHKRVPRLGES